MVECQPIRRKRRTGGHDDEVGALCPALSHPTKRRSLGQRTEEHLTRVECAKSARSGHCQLIRAQRGPVGSRRTASARVVSRAHGPGGITTQPSRLIQFWRGRAASARVVSRAHGPGGITTQPSRLIQFWRGRAASARVVSRAHGPGGITTQPSRLISSLTIPQPQQSRESNVSRRRSRYSELPD